MLFCTLLGDFQVFVGRVPPKRRLCNS